MTKQYQHMTLVIENGKVIKVDNPQNSGVPFWESLKAGVLEPLPGSLVNQTVAFALNQLSAQKWEVINLPPGNSQPVEAPRPFSLWPGLTPHPTPAPNTGSYEILLRKVIRK